MFLNNKDVIKYDVVDWQRYFRLIESVGTSCDDRKNRFDKADIFEQGLEEYSQGKYRWDDKIGYDALFLPTQEKFEIKSQKHVFYTKKTGGEKENTAKIRMTNTLGDSSERVFPKRFDYLMIIDSGSAKSYSIGIVEWSVVNENIKHEGDAWSVQMPLDKISFLFKPSDLKLLQNKTNTTLSYSEQKGRMQSDFVKGVL